MHYSPLYKIIAILFMCVFSNNAFAISCERTTSDTQGYKNKQAFESWWPKNLNFEVTDFEEAGSGSKAMVDLWEGGEKGTGNQFTMKLRLLPNNVLIGSVKPYGSYAAVNNIRYKCDKNSNEVRQALASGSKANTNSTNSSSSVEKGCFDGNVSVCTSEQLCNRATSRRSGVKQWDSIKQFQPFVAEAKSRGLSCGVSDTSTPTTSTSSSKLDKAKSTCTELGFTLGTEKHGECVLKMMDN